MTTIEEKLARKRMELTAAQNEQERKWQEFKVAEENLRARWQTPWHESMKRERVLKNEVVILEGVLKEMAVA